MTNLKELKVRINSIKNTQKITKAMKVVSASKLKKARNQAEDASPYAEKMAGMVNSLAASANVEELPLLSGDKKNKMRLLIIVTSNKGLCGNFNSSIFKATKEKIASLKSDNVKLFCIGKKGYDILAPLYGDKIIGKSLITKKNILCSDLKIVADEILSLFEQGKFGSCSIIFNKFKTAISQEVTTKQLIPVEFSDNNNQEAAIYEYEPSEKEILEELLPKNFAVQIFYAFLESLASEQGARMTAMDNATRNAGELIKSLTLLFNRTRQATITKELIEIISGAEAV